MPKVSVSLNAVKARGAEILEKLSKVEEAAQGHRQRTKLNQHRVQWTEQAKKLSAEAKRLEEDLRESSLQLGFSSELVAEVQATDEVVSDIWFQVSGVRRLISQVKRRGAHKAQAEVLELQAVLGSVLIALTGLSGQMVTEASELEHECGALRRALRQELVPAGLWSGNTPSERTAEDRCDLSDEEDMLLENLMAFPEEDYSTELQRLNDQFTAELTLLDQEIAEHRRKRAGWDEESHSRFVSIRRELQGRSRDLLLDRWALEFPHLTREQIQQHEAHCDALKYSLQKEAAAFRQWRRERFALLRRHQAKVEAQRQAQEVAEQRKQVALELRDKQKQLQGRLLVERARVSVVREERQKREEEMRLQREAEEAEKEEWLRKRQQQVKELSLEFQEKRREELLREETEAAEKKRLEEEERVRRMEHNIEVVRIRRQMDELKQREIAEKRLSLEQESQDRERRLQRAMENLRIEAPRDPQRLLAVPSRAQVPAYQDPLVCVARGPQAGFEERRLMADARYRLSAALQAAGLFDTQAGHEVLARMPAPKPAQPHMVSQVFTSGYPQ